jgi:hypothetical protein
MGNKTTLLLLTSLAACSDLPPDAARPAEQIESALSALLVDDRSQEIVTEIASQMPGAGDDCTTQVRWAFAALHANVNTATANQRLAALDTTANVPDSTAFESIGCYWAMPLLVRTYAHSTTSARLSPAAKTALENMMWRYVRRRSLYSDATWPNTWHIHMSENHDAMQKSVFLLATNALRAIKGDGALLADGKSLLQHQNAWRSFWKLYFLERAREGIGLEIASPAYAKHSLQNYYNVRDFGGSSLLREQAEKFLTLYWADVAQDFQRTTGVRGGAQTRAYRDKYAQTGGAQAGLRPWTYIYGWNGPKDWTDPNFITSLFPATSSYRIPAIVSDMATSATKSAFVYASRRPGQHIQDPHGEGDTLRYHIGFDQYGNSNLRRYTFNTADYVMGTLKVDASPPPPPLSPPSRYSGLNRQNRWMGVVFANSPDARIAVFGRGTGGDNPDLENRNGYGDILGDAGPNVMLVARDPSAEASTGTRIFISDSIWNNGLWGQGGWLFMQSGNGYAGVRIAAGGYTIVSTAFGKLLELSDMWSPIVIQLGQASEYASYTAFRSTVAAAPYSYVNGQVTYTDTSYGWTYTIQRNSFVLPTVNGGGSLDPAKTYSSPYILGWHGENTVTLDYDSRPSLVLDFTL